MWWRFKDIKFCYKNELNIYLYGIVLIVNKVVIKDFIVLWSCLYFIEVKLNWENLEYIVFY